MNFLLDIIIALIIGLTVFSAVKNGLIKTAISAVSFLVAVIITLTFSTPLANSLKETSIAESIREATEQKITDIISEGSYGINDLLSGASEEFNALITVAGMDNEDIKKIVTETVTDALTKPSTDVAKDIAPTIAKHISVPIIDLIATLVAIIILFFGTQIVLAVVAKLLDIVAKLPILNSFNKAGGLILGIVLAFIRVCLFCFIINVLIENKDFLGVEFISNLEPDKTLLFSFFRNIDIFKFFIS